MHIELLNINDFLKADERTTGNRTIGNFLLRGLKGIATLSKIATFQKLILENDNDMDTLSSWFLPWYKPNSKGEDDWRNPGTYNYSIAEYVEYIKTNNIRPKDIELIKRILTRKMDIISGRGKSEEITVIFDSTLNKRVVVDGCKLSVALILLRNENKAAFIDKLDLEYPNTIFQLSSPWAHCLYPCDFTSVLETQISNFTVKSRADISDGALKELIDLLNKI